MINWKDALQYPFQNKFRALGRTSFYLPDGPFIASLSLFLSLFVFSPSEQLLAVEQPPDSARKATSLARWHENSPNLRGLRLSTVAFFPGENPITVVGCTTGSIFVNYGRDRGWYRAMSMAVPEKLIKKLNRDDMLFFRKFGGIEEKDMNNITSMIEEDVEQRSVDLSDISYDDLTFEDIDISSVDISDIEFRDTVDQDEINLEDINEEDIETIHITDESYLRNPQAVYDRLTGETDVKQRQRVELSQRELERVLAGYNETFLTISQIFVPQNKDSPFFALSPFIIYISRDRGRSWQIHLESRWKQGEFFIRMASSRTGSGQLLLLSNKNVKYSENMGGSWNELPLPVSHAHYRSIQLKSVPPRECLVLTVNSLFRTTLDDEFPGLVPTENISPGMLMVGEFLCFDSVGSRITVGCQEGLLLTENSGKDWTQIQSTDLPFGPVSQVILFARDSSWILVLAGGTPYFSTDGGTTFVALTVQESGDGLIELSCERLDSGSYILCGVSDRRTYYLSISPKGVPESVSTGMGLFFGKTDEPPFFAVLPDYRELLGGAKRQCLWTLSEYSRFRSRARLAGFIPKFYLNFSYYSGDQFRVSISQNIDFRDEPDRYIIGPDETTSYTYANEYYMVSCYLRWDLRRLIQPRIPNITRKMSGSFRRMKKQEKKLRDLYHNHKILEEQLDISEDADTAAYMDMLLKTWEIEALLTSYTRRH